MHAWTYKSFLDQDLLHRSMWILQNYVLLFVPLDKADFC